MRFRAHLHSKCRKSVKIVRGKQNVLLKNSIWDLKNAEFHADFQFVEKVLKNAHKKVIGKNVMEIRTFFPLTHVCHICLLPTFLVHLKIFFLKVIFALFLNFEANCTKKGTKNQKTYFVNKSSISILHPSEVQGSSFS